MAARFVLGTFPQQGVPFRRSWQYNPLLSTILTDRTYDEASACPDLRPPAVPVRDGATGSGGVTALRPGERRTEWYEPGGLVQGGRAGDEPAHRVRCFRGRDRNVRLRQPRRGQPERSEQDDHHRAGQRDGNLQLRQERSGDSLS